LTNKIRAMIPTALQPGEILAHSIGTCHCPTSRSHTKAKARASPNCQTDTKIVSFDFFCQLCGQKVIYPHATSLMKINHSQTLSSYGTIIAIILALAGCTFTPHEEYVAPIQPPEPISVSFVVNDPAFKDPYYLLAATRFNFRLKDLANPIIRGEITVDGTLINSSITNNNGVDFSLNPYYMSAGTHTVNLVLFVDTQTRSLANILGGEFYVVEQSFTVIVDSTVPTFQDPVTASLEDGFLTLRWKAVAQRNFMYKIRRSGSAIGFLPDTLVYDTRENHFVDPGYVGGMLNYQIIAIGFGFEKVVGSGSFDQSQGDFKVTKDANRVVRLVWSQNFINIQNTQMTIQMGSKKRTQPFTSSGNITLDTLGLTEGLTIFINFARTGYLSQMTGSTWTVSPTPNLKPFILYAMLKQQNKLLIASEKFIYRYNLQGGLVLEDSLSLVDAGVTELWSLIVSQDGSHALMSGRPAGFKLFDPLNFDKITSYDIEPVTRKFTDSTYQVSPVGLGSVSNNGLVTVVFGRGKSYTMVLDINNGKVIWNSPPGTYEMPIISKDGNFLKADIYDPYQGQLYKRTGDGFTLLGVVDLGDCAFLPNGTELINFSRISNSTENVRVSAYNLISPPPQPTEPFAIIRSATIPIQDLPNAITYDQSTNLLALRYLEQTKLMETSNFTYVKTIPGQGLIFANNYVLMSNGFIEEVK
jgi:hypothetical protein